jgi:hypothetical protein
MEGLEVLLGQRVIPGVSVLVLFSRKGGGWIVLMADRWCSIRVLPGMNSLV